jgi:hypothetical protein
MTYLLDGKQYIALMGGNGVAPQRGDVAPPFAFGPGFGEPTAAAANRGQTPPPPPPPNVLRPRLYVYALQL